MAIYYKGKSLNIHITADGEKSIRDLAAAHANDIVSRMARINTLLKVLADTGRLRSPDQFRQEGEKFWAVRAGPVRAYGWYDPNDGFVISHLIYKNETKLASADSKRMQRNKRDYK